MFAMSGAHDRGSSPMPKRECDPFPSADDISDRAYELFISDGRDPSQIPRCWRQAEMELLMRAADRIIAQYVKHQSNTRSR